MVIIIPTLQKQLLRVASSNLARTALLENDRIKIQSQVSIYIPNYSLTEFISQGCCKKSLHTWWLKTTIYSLPALKTGTLPSVAGGYHQGSAGPPLLQGSRESLLPSSSSSSTPRPVVASRVSLPLRSHCPFLLCLCKIALLRTQWLHHRVHRDNPG